MVNRYRNVAAIGDWRYREVFQVDPSPFRTFEAAHVDYAETLEVDDLVAPAVMARWAEDVQARYGALRSAERDQDEGSECGVGVGEG